MEDSAQNGRNKSSTLKRGWTTGACATAATKSALFALLEGEFPDPVQIELPGGQKPFFSLAHENVGEGWAEAGIIKDAGDDPDVTHGATIISRISHNPAGGGITFHAGTGVGTFTKPGLPLRVGEPAINPVPRQMMVKEIKNICAHLGITPDFSVTIFVPNGEKIAQKTWNPRLGIIGGISILGTTGIVIPYSCSAWIHSIHSGIDVARATGLVHLVGSTGNLSEKAAKKSLNLPDEAFIDMGDFVGGMLKYLRKKPVEKITIAGGFAKICKLSHGAMDLHSARSTVNFGLLSDMAGELGADEKLTANISRANSANHALEMAREARIPLADLIAQNAKKNAAAMIKNPAIGIDIIIIDRTGNIIAKAGP